MLHWHSATLSLQFLFATSIKASYMWLPGWIKFSKSDTHTHTHTHTEKDTQNFYFLSLFSWFWHIYIYIYDMLFHDLMHMLYRIVFHYFACILGIILYSFIINIRKLVKKMGRKIFYGNLQDINFSKTQLSAYMKTLFFNRFDNSWKNDNDNKK